MNTHISYKKPFNNLPGHNGGDVSDIERGQQIEFGRKKLSFKGDNAMKDKASARVVDRRDPIKKIQKSGHEASLAKVVSERRSVRILLLEKNDDESGFVEFEGELLEFDKYSVRIRLADGRCLWLFKSAMVGFEEI